MLYSVGSRPHYGDVGDLLLSCHQRIREHLVLARRIAMAPPSTSNESVRAAAARVRRYLGEAFALHQADEEDDLFPILIGRSDAINETIARLLEDHDACKSGVEKLVEMCLALERDPASLPAHAADLGRLVQLLETLLVAHIRFEENALLPAIELLSAHEREDVVARMRARRDLVNGEEPL